MAPLAPPIAEGRAFIRVQSRSEEQVRIDALERKLDEVLKQLEGLRKKPEDDGKK